MAKATHVKRIAASTAFNVLCAAGVIVVLLFCIPYAQGYTGDRVTLAQSVRSLWGNEQWRHCWLVVPAIGAIVYAQRKQLACLRAQGTSWGLSVLALAFAFYWAGYRVGNYYLGFFSIHLMLGGLILWLGGWKWLSALAFAYGFLVFVWPLYFLENWITFPLRMFMARASAGVLDLLGVPVILQGTGIVSAPEPLVGLRAGNRFRVDVADPCSGIRSLFALMMIAALYGYFLLHGRWQRVVLLASSIPLAILGNLLRILMLTFGIMTMGPDIAIGRHPLTDPSWFHTLAGYLVFAVAFGGMLGVGLLLAAPRGEGKRIRQRLDAAKPRELPSSANSDLY